MPSNCLIFDLDGVLAESGKPIPAYIENALQQRAAKGDDIFIVSGAHVRNITKRFIGLDPDYEGMVPNLCTSTAFVHTFYGCLGNEIWTNGRRFVRNTDFKISEELKTVLYRYYYAYMDYKVEFADHLYNNAELTINERPGMINWSFIDRRAPDHVKTQFERSGIRETIVILLRTMFPEYQFLIGGRTSIDICKVGKEQIKDECLGNSKIYQTYGDTYFFCDRGDTDLGNDFLLAQRIKSYHSENVFHIKAGPAQTASILNGLEAIVKK
jgi:hydroxymethylpyrimidine pyrophosphatase-like HAD family hydrolase